MNFIWIILLLLLGEIVLVVIRPKGWSLLLTSMVFLQGILFCVISVIVIPVLVSGVLTLRDDMSSGNATDYESGEGLLPYRTGEGGIVSNSVLHGPIVEWRGIDYTRACGLQLVAPADMIVVGVGGDDGAGNPSLRVRLVADNSIELGYVHGRYTVATGEYVVAGDVFGTTASIGVSTGCHDHLVLWIGGAVRDISRSTSPSYVIAGQKPLIMSSYNPHEGGINCDSDCRVTASGALVADWWGAGAACIKDWTDRGVVVVIEGRPWKCIDTGGDIVETGDGIWVDLLTKDSGYVYGSLVYDWEVN